MISQDIALGKYKTDTGLPSINYLSKTYNVSRDTVFKAFLDLREKRLIDSTPGKGYYVINRQKNILLLLDEYSAFKNTLYNSFIKKLSQSYKVDLWFHQYNERIFRSRRQSCCYWISGNSTRKTIHIFARISTRRFITHCHNCWTS